MKTAEEKKQYRKEQYLKNKDKEKAAREIYYSKNKELILARNKKYNKENPDKRKSAILKYEYGITLDQYNEMFKEQEGKCAICQRHQNKLTRTLCVDHDHKTNKVRALLCLTCNTDVSVVENRLEEMTNYLNKYRKDVN
jgi:prolyl oligopeptidase PreP (S9A serine peptidase family)